MKFEIRRAGMMPVTTNGADSNFVNADINVKFLPVFYNRRLLGRLIGQALKRTKAPFVEFCTSIERTSHA
jgi:hypothetical protein